MDLFKDGLKSGIEHLISKINEENLCLLDIDERSSQYYLNKLFIWQNDIRFINKSDALKMMGRFKDATKNIE